MAEPTKPIGACCRRPCRSALSRDRCYRVVREAPRAFEDFASLGQPDLTARAIEQKHVKVALKLRYLPRGG